MFIIVRPIVEPIQTRGKNIVTPVKSHSTGCCPCRSDTCAFVSFYMLVAIICCPCRSDTCAFVSFYMLVAIIASIFVGATLAREWYEDPNGETIFLCILGSFVVLVVGVLGFCKCCVSVCYYTRKSEPVLPT
jgi:hypothetical protein